MAHETQSAAPAATPAPVTAASVPAPVYLSEPPAGDDGQGDGGDEPDIDSSMAAYLAKLDAPDDDAGESGAPAQDATTAAVSEAPATPGQTPASETDELKAKIEALTDMVQSLMGNGTQAAPVAPMAPAIQETTPAPSPPPAGDDDVFMAHARAKLGEDADPADLADYAEAALERAMLSRYKGKDGVDPKQLDQRLAELTERQRLAETYAKLARENREIRRDFTEFKTAPQRTQALTESRGHLVATFAKPSPEVIAAFPGLIVARDMGVMDEAAEVIIEMATTKADPMSGKAWSEAVSVQADAISPRLKIEVDALQASGTARASVLAGLKAGAINAAHMRLLDAAAAKMDAADKAKAPASAAPPRKPGAPPVIGDSIAPPARDNHVITADELSAGHFDLDRSMRSFVASRFSGARSAANG